MLALLRLLKCHYPAPRPKVSLSCLNRLLEGNTNNVHSSASAYSRLLKCYDNDLLRVITAHSTVFTLSSKNNDDPLIEVKRHMPESSFARAHDITRSIAQEHVGLWLPLKLVFTHKLSRTTKETLSFKLFRSLVHFDWGFAVCVCPPQNTLTQSKRDDCAVGFFAIQSPMLNGARVPLDRLNLLGMPTLNDVRVIASKRNQPVNVNDEDVRISLTSKVQQVRNVGENRSFILKALRQPHLVVYSTHESYDLTQVLSESEVAVARPKNNEEKGKTESIKSVKYSVTPVSYFDKLKHIRHCLPNGLPREFTKVVWEWWWSGLDDEKKSSRRKLAIPHDTLDRIFLPLIQRLSIPAESMLDVAHAFPILFKVCAVSKISMQYRPCITLEHLMASVVPSIEAQPSRWHPIPSLSESGLRANLLSSVLECQVRQSVDGEGLFVRCNQERTLQKHFSGLRSMFSPANEGACHVITNR